MNLEEFINNIPINDLVNKYIKLKKISRLYWGLCPFHHENTPSFVVNNDKKFFYCFGCGSGGNAINFLMKIKDKSFPEAIQELNDIYQLKYEIPSSTISHYYQHQEYEKKIMDFFTNYIKICHQKLMINNEALRYLTDRNLSLDIIRSFSLGYDDGQVNDLIELGYSMSEIQEYGILSGEWDSKFKNRIILPITNNNGQYISVTGRILHGSKNTVKYLHAIENSIFYKKTTFFNFSNVKEHQEISIVEGFFDMLSCINHGMTNVVACLGATISEEQIFILQKKYKTIHLLLDGDEAGLEGMIKAAYKFIPYYGNTRVFFYILPGIDPADYFQTNSIQDLPSYNLEDFLWEYYIKPKENIIDGTTITKIYKTIEALFNALKKQGEIHEKTQDILQKYWQKKTNYLIQIFHKSPKKTHDYLPVVPQKSQFLIISLFHKAHEIGYNLDQLSKLYIEEKRMFYLFNKIINLMVEMEETDLVQLQKIILDNLNNEETNIIQNPFINSIVQFDPRSLNDIINEEFF
jgi:DNA primase catalytic core